MSDASDAPKIAFAPHFEMRVVGDRHGLLRSEDRECHPAESDGCASGSIPGPLDETGLNPIPCLL